MQVVFFRLDFSVVKVIFNTSPSDQEETDYHEEMLEKCRLDPAEYTRALRWSETMSWF